MLHLSNVIFKTQTLLKSIYQQSILDVFVLSFQNANMFLLSDGVLRMCQVLFHPHETKKKKKVFMAQFLKILYNVGLLDVGGGRWSGKFT